MKWKSLLKKQKTTLVSLLEHFPAYVLLFNFWKNLCWFSAWQEPGNQYNSYFCVVPDIRFSFSLKWIVIMFVPMYGVICTLQQETNSLRDLFLGYAHRLCEKGIKYAQANIWMIFTTSWQDFYPYGIVKSTSCAKCLIFLLALLMVFSGNNLGFLDDLPTT